MKNNTHTIFFGLKRFLRYFSIGIICSITPMHMAGFAIILFPLILFSIILSVDDIGTYQQLQHYPPTFSLSFWGICIVALFLDWITWVLYNNVFN